MPANPRKLIVYNFKTYGYFLRPDALTFLEDYLKDNTPDQLKAQIYQIIDGINSIKQSDSTFSSDMFITESILRNALTFISQGQNEHPKPMEGQIDKEKNQISDLLELANQKKQGEMEEERHHETINS